MSELRKDPIVNRWVIISTERKKRPTGFVIKKEEIKGGFCPFCEGNEEHTPPEISAYRQNGSLPNKGGWSLRVVPNKFPALQIEGDLGKAGVGLYDKMNGIGAHEVIIESPKHEDSLASLTELKFKDVLSAYKDRIIDLQKDKRFKYMLVFKNHGEAAGASLEHTHSQLIALPIIPRRVALELDGAKEHYGLKERCIFCDIIRQELEQQERIVLDAPDFVVISPFAPRFPFETWILPKRHSIAFEDSTPEEFESLARVFSNLLKRMEKTLNNPPYNFLLHNAPSDGAKYPLTSEYWHWHFEVIPVLTKVAGFEWGTGFFINPTPPEEAAQYLREAEL